MNKKHYYLYAWLIKEYQVEPVEKVLVQIYAGTKYECLALWKEFLNSARQDSLLITDPKRRRNFMKQVKERYILTEFKLDENGKIID